MVGSLCDVVWWGGDVGGLRQCSVRMVMALSLVVVGCVVVVECMMRQRGILDTPMQSMDHSEKRIACNQTKI